MCFKSVNWDDALSYDTTKIVRVRDAKLGLLRIIFMVLIIAYISIKVMWLDTAYNVHDTPTGAVRISLEYPRSPFNLSDEPFCPQSPEHDHWKFESEKEYPCQIWDEHSIRYPADEINSIFVTTRAHIQRQQYHCGQENTPDEQKQENSCERPFEILSDYTIFLAGVRDYTLGVQHSFYSPQFKSPKWSGNSRALYGRLVDTKGKVIKEFPSQKKGDDSHLIEMPDIISVGELLQASDTDLYQPSKDPNNSQYYSGVVLMILVNYGNNRHSISYTYKVKQIPNADYKLFESRWDVATDTRGLRTVVKRAGVKAIFLITGDFAHFDFQTLLIQFVSAMGLLSVCTLVVEFIMLNIMKFRKYYREAKFDVTDDFSSLYHKSKHGEAHDPIPEELDGHVNIDDFNTRLLPTNHKDE